MNQILDTSGAEQISFFIPSFRGGGVEGSVVRLSNTMAKRGMKTTIVVLEETGPWRERVDEGVDIVNFGSGRASRSRIPLIRFFLKSKPDIFISNLTHLNILSVLAHTLARSRSKLFLVEHNHMLSGSAWSENARNLLLSHGISRLYGRAHNVLAVSAGVRQGLLQHFGLRPDKVKVLHNPVDIELIDRVKDAGLEHPWLSDPSIKVILGVGRLDYLKGWDYLIESLAIVRRTIDARLIILGEGELESDLLNQAAELGLDSSLDLIGFQSNPYAWMAASDVFAFPSRSEGFGIALVEAMAAGVPVVANDCPSGPAEILERGSFGLLVPVGDTHALANAILTLLTQPGLANELTSKAIERVKDFSVERIASKLSKVLDLE